MNTIAFLCVNYNNARYTIEFCDSLATQLNLGSSLLLDCLIIDNSTNAEDSEVLTAYTKELQWINYVKTPQNLGYFGGLNYGLSLINLMTYDFIVICNNDLVFEPDFCKQLLALNYPENVMAICPDVITKDGIHQNPHNLVQIGLFQRFQFDLFFSHYVFAKVISFALKMFRPIKKSSVQLSAGREIHMGIGACYVLTERFFKKFNKLDYPHFLYAEEAYLTNQIHSAGGSLWFEPSMRVCHSESASLSKIPRRAAYEFGRSSYWGCRQFLLNRKNNSK